MYESYQRIGPLGIRWVDKCNRYHNVFGSCWKDHICGYKSLNYCVEGIQYYNFISYIKAVIKYKKKNK